MTLATSGSTHTLKASREAAVRRSELANFLRTRRERISPEQHGLPVGGRRRTPGLRREEVAQLAGVGVTWYTWLEQQRDIKPSEQVLNAIADTLMLDQNERAHLFILAGIAEPPIVQECKAVPEPIHQVLTQLEPFPACVFNARTDILAFNQTYDRLVGGISLLPLEERNVLVLGFTNHRWRRCSPNWDKSAARLVGQFRAAMAKHVAEASWKSLVKRLRQESKDFEALWQRHDIGAPENVTKSYLHPEVGMLNFEYSHLWTGERSEVRLTTYAPSNEETHQKLITLQSLIVNNVPIPEEHSLIENYKVLSAS